MVFKRSEGLLDLYNSLNKSHHDNPDDLEIATLEFEGIPKLLQQKHVGARTFPFCEAVSEVYRAAQD